MGNIKTIIINRIIAKIEIQIDNAERGRKFNIEESKAHKGAMASRYDTFKEEAQYLAGGYTRSLIDLGKILGALKSIRDYPPIVIRSSVYAIVEIKNLDDGLRAKYFLLPSGGGDTYEVDGKEITVINVGVPIAHALIGTVVGDEVEVKIQGTTRRFSVVSVT